MTKPTDAELDKLIRDANPTQGLRHDSRDLPVMSLRKLMRDAIAKWGTPPAVAGEPVAWEATVPGYIKYVTQSRYEKFSAIAKSGYKPYKCSNCATPQPTQAQAGAVPLTCEWTHNDDDSSWDTECGQSWRFDDGGPKENRMNFCHCCGKTLRIKGGRHGTE